MCRLFGLHAVTPVHATFWLVDAPDSLATQSRRNPDGAGIGVFLPDGAAHISKQPLAAWEDTDFASAAQSFTGSTFLAHVRYASTGALTPENTHPFSQDGRLFAHNGVIGGLDELEARLADLEVADLVGGQTDSERVFALITGETRRAGGDIQKGIVAAARWIAANLPVYSLNFVITTADQMFVLRYPDTHDLFILDRRRTGRHGLHARSMRIRAHAPELVVEPAVVVATEKMDDDPRWRSMPPGELLCVDHALQIHRHTSWVDAPRHPLHLTDLDPHAAASQHPVTSSA